ncbi:hypothetical protein [Nocardia sp. NPDC050435]
MIGPRNFGVDRGNPGTGPLATGALRTGAPTTGGAYCPGCGPY